MLKGFWVLFISVVLCVASPFSVMAQEETVESDFASGSVLQASQTGVTIEVFGEEEKAFVITDETILENLGSMDELNEGEIIFVDFFEKEGHNIALNILRLGESYNDEDMYEGDEQLSDELGEEPDMEMGNQIGEEIDEESGEDLGYEQEEKE